MKLHKKIGIASVLLFVALIVTGLAYAHWQQTLYIRGNIETGSFSVGFTPTLVISDNELEKDVGKVTAKTVDIDGDGINDKIEVTIDNGYPCYEAFIDCFIHNYGSIPVKIQDITLSAPPELTVEIDWYIYKGMQIDPGEEVMAEIYVHVLQEAEQGLTYTFTATMDLIQWNEYAP